MAKELERLCKGDKKLRSDAEGHLNNMLPTNENEKDHENKHGGPSKPPPGPPLPVFVPGYEKLKELGQGGMGKVYQARQTKLGRVVALKMILSGAHAGEADLARFRTEGEAIARLQHPNIVQIYEVGEQGGLPFFSLEFCGGGSLEKKLNGTPLPPQEAAALVETLARAMDAAHQKGVIHRDLKPANVLLAEDGTPKITDFGLAKKLDEAGQTASGAVMGTPSYMAPEQASGEAVGPAADVYALGAILYECQTGRPPFKGADALDTLEQVRSREPVPVRQLQPKVPRDLETITLTCLEKDPGKRYRTGKELAEDLRRFLDGKPIVARPAGPFERLVKWLRRHPLATVVIVAVSALVISLAVAVVLVSSALKRAEAEKHDRIMARIDALSTASPGAVGVILDDLETAPDDVLPELRRRWEDPDPQKKPTRYRYGLGLLRHEPDKVWDELSTELPNLDDPAEVLLVRDDLKKHGAHETELRKSFWERAVDGGAAPAQHFRMLAALAAFDPDSKEWPKHAGDVVNQLLSVNVLHLRAWMEGFRPVKEKLSGPLAEAFHLDQSPQRREVAAILLADYVGDDPVQVAKLIQDADVKQFAVLFPKLKVRRDEAIAPLKETIEKSLDSVKTNEDKERLAKQQANAAAALLNLNEPNKTWSLLKHRSDPRARSYLIHVVVPVGTEPGPIIQRLAEEQDVSTRRALLLMLGEFREDRLSATDREAVLGQVRQLYQHNPDAGTHAAAEWLLRRWGHVDELKKFEEGWVRDGQRRTKRLGEIRQNLAKGDGREEAYWYVNGQGQTMVVLPGPAKFNMGSPTDEDGREEGPRGPVEERYQKRIGRSFMMNGKEVTIEQFLRFRPVHKYSEVHSPDKDWPANRVSWYDAAAYCNWLSEKEGIPPDQWCYVSDAPPAACASTLGLLCSPHGPGAFLAASALFPGRPDKGANVGWIKLADDYLHREGYRLPSEAEWEYACRAGADTSRYFGETEDLLGEYAWYTKNSRDEKMLRCGTKKPNDFGLFDMLGNAQEWCQEQYVAGLMSYDDQERSCIVLDGNLRIMRGCTFLSIPTRVRSANRMWYIPDRHQPIDGFRPVRTLPWIDGNMTEQQAFDGLDPTCPKEVRDSQTIVEVVYCGFDKQLHRGQLVLDRDLVKDVQEVFDIALKAKFPIGSVVPISHAKFRKDGRWDDGLSMEANNTSAFNFRTMTGSTKLSNHAYGRAIDINPLQNPYVKGDVVLPRGAKYDPKAEGTLSADSPIVKAFLERGWAWGGSWNSLKDYQHFEKPLKMEK